MAKLSIEEIWSIDRPLVAAHRGASGDHPENTLPAFVAAGRAGADLIELDYHHSADGVPVVIHDATLDRTTDARVRWRKEGLRVDQTESDVLATLDAGAWFDPTFRGTRAPTLSEAIEVIDAYAMPLLERKAGDAATVVGLLEKKGMIAKAIVQAFDWDFVADCRAIAPGLLLGALGKGPIAPEAARNALARGARFLGWDHRDLTRGAVETALNAGLQVWTWTVDDPNRAVELVSFGVRVITSNWPRRMIERFARP